jgi:hypothetical protein
MAITQICLDMDGVLCDFLGPVSRLLGCEEKLADWPRGMYGFDQALGRSNRAIWTAIDKAGYQFWADLPPYDWCRDLYQHCRELAPTVILTSPSMHVSSLKGKMCWLQRHFGREFREYLIGPPKHACARPGAVLIDDSDLNCDRFVEAGGYAIRFPRLWNSSHGESHDPLEFTRSRLASIAAIENRRPAA